MGRLSTNSRKIAASVGFRDVWGGQRRPIATSGGGLAALAADAVTSGRTESWSLKEALWRACSLATMHYVMWPSTPSKFWLFTLKLLNRPGIFLVLTLVTDPCTSNVADFADSNFVPIPTTATTHSNRTGQPPHHAEPVQPTYIARRLPPTATDPTHPLTLRAATQDDAAKQSSVFSGKQRGRASTSLHSSALTRQCFEDPKTYPHCHVSCFTNCWMALNFTWHVSDSRVWSASLG